MTSPLPTNIANRLSLFALCALAVSVSLGVALVSVSKVLVVLALLVWIPLRWRSRAGQSRAQGRYWSPWVVLMALAWMGLSFLWTSASLAEAGTAMARHARFLVFPITLALLTWNPQARTVLKYLVLGQLFVVVCSWLMFFGVALPWAKPEFPTEMGILFTSTLEQPIMSTLMLIVLWYLHPLFAPQAKRWLVWTLVLLTVGNVFFVMTGRTGYLVMFLAVALAIWLPARRQQRGWVILAVMLLGLALGLTSTRLQTRVLEVRSEVAGYLKGNTESSQGRRLDYWKRSLKAISEKPLLGHGVGSWKPQYVRLGGLDALPPSNPHNQYLLWAVEGGLIGMAFMIAILVALYRDAQQMGKTVQRAMLTTLAIVVAMCLFNCPFFGAGMGEFLLLMLGALLALGRETSTEACPAQAPQIRCA